MADNNTTAADSTDQQQPPAPDDVAQMLIDQQGDRYALSVAAEIRRLAYPDREDDNTTTQENDQPEPRRGYNVPADSASMRGYISARGTA